MQECACVLLACAVATILRHFYTHSLWWWVAVSGLGAHGRYCHLSREFK